MADLSALAANVKTADEWAPQDDSPMATFLKGSYEGRTKVGRGKSARVYGKPFELEITTYDDLKTAKNGLQTAARKLGYGLSLAYFGPEVQTGEVEVPVTDEETGEPIVDEDTDEPLTAMVPVMERPKLQAIRNEQEWKDTSGNNVLLKFRYRPLRELKDEDDGDNGDQ
jgi:hypothetical protein